MRVNRLNRRSFLLGSFAAGALACDKKGAEGESSDEIGPLMAPSLLATRLDEIKSGKVVVLYTGPEILFGRGHVPGARSVGEAGTKEGIAAIEAAISATPKETEIVLYCGCCPIRSCPNIRPASAALRRLKRNNAFWLDLPTRFATDWTEKGYAVERS